MQPGGNRLFLFTVSTKEFKTRSVFEDTSIVRVLPPQDGGTRRTTGWSSYEKICKDRALSRQQCIRIVHIGHNLQIQIIGQDEHEVGSSFCRGERVYDLTGGNEQDKEKHQERPADFGWHVLYHEHSLR